MFIPDPDEQIALRPTTVYVDTAALRANVQSVRARVGAGVRIMAIVKANAYGHGLVRSSVEFLAAGADALGVAFLEEGIALRRAGIRAPILVLGGIIGNQIQHFLSHDLELCASSVFKLQQIDEVAGRLGVQAKIHLKLDTGMERIGMRAAGASVLFEAALAARHVSICGVFSHLAESDAADAAFTRLQLERFNEALDFFPRRGLPMPPRHLANSGGILQHPETWFEIVRPGIMLYGVYPARSVARSVVVRPALSLKTRVVYFKVVTAGTSVSYNRTWTAVRDTRVVTLPVGYGDGYSRSLSGKAQILIGGQRHPIVGLITMDALMVDIGSSSAYNGDEAVLIGSQGAELITCEELADFLGTIPYEILTSINTRVPRHYV